MQTLQPGHIRAILDPQVFAVYTGVAIRGLSYKRIDGAWRIIVKGTKRDGSLVYSLFAAVELEDAIHKLLTLLSSKGGMRYWHPDKYG